MIKEKAYIGIDPGQTGAIATLTPDGVDVMDWGELHDIVMQIKEWQEDYDIKAMIEKVHAMPKQGVSSTFKFGENYGTWKGILYTLGIPFYMVTPQKWQSKMLSDSDELTTKKRSLDVARRLYPSIGRTYLKRQKDNGRADALLIATYCKLTTIYT